MRHLAGWYESIDLAGAAGDITAMADTQLFVSVDIVRAPADLAMLAGAARASASANFVAAQVQAPSLRQLANFDIGPVSVAAVFGNPPELAWMGENPIQMQANESVTFNVEDNPAAPTAEYGFVWFSDGAPPAANGAIFTVRGTLGITLAAGVWTNGAITFSQDLPFGEYDVVGFRCVSTNGLAARLVFVGGRWRPGVLIATTEAVLDSPFFRYGRGGVMGHFNSNTPPSVDAVGITDTTQVVYLDLIRTA